MIAALPAAAAVKPKQPRKVLVLAKAAGYVHSTIPLAARTVEEMGKKTGAWSATITYDPADINEQNLKQYDAIFLASTTGHFLDDPEGCGGHRGPPKGAARFRARGRAGAAPGAASGGGGGGGGPGAPGTRGTPSDDTRGWRQTARARPPARKTAPAPGGTSRQAPRAARRVARVQQDDRRLLQVPLERRPADHT